MIRAHIKRYLNLNKYNTVNELINDRSIVSKEMLNKLQKGCFGFIPTSLDSFDITESFALIHNVINELHRLPESKFQYDNNKYDYCLKLKKIRKPINNMNVLNILSLSKNIKFST